MPHPEANLATTERANAKKKKKDAKKTFAERLAGKAPFAWLKLDVPIGIGK